MLKFIEVIIKNSTEFPQLCVPILLKTIVGGGYYLFYWATINFDQDSDTSEEEGIGEESLFNTDRKVKAVYESQWSIRWREAPTKV